MMPPKGVIEQLVLVDSPEQVPLKDGDVIGNLFGAQDFQVDVDSLRGAFLLRQLCLCVGQLLVTVKGRQRKEGLLTKASR